MMSKYFNPYTDFGFKKLFGEEASKHLLIDFLNTLLVLQEPIIDLTFKNAEQLGQNEFSRKAVYDIYCENIKGEKIIVEMQKAKQNYFKDRTIYYSTFPISEQAAKGDWNYKLKAVYCVGILDFTFDHPNKTDNEVVHKVELKDTKNRVFYDKLRYVYLEMPNFTKQDFEINTNLDKWLYFIKNLENLEKIPHIFQNTIFVEAFEKAELAKFTDKELFDYELNLKTYRDYKNTMDTAFDEGKIEANIEMAKKMKTLKIAVEIILQTTGLTKEMIEEL